MRRVHLLSLPLLFLFASTAFPLDVEERKEGFLSLFNGKDFTGWRFGKDSAASKLPSNWKVEDGVIKLSGGGSPHLASQWDYEDFDARFEWRALRKGYNSGFYIRSGRMVGANQINLAQSACGGFIGGKLEGAKPVNDLQKPPTEWNEWRVLVVGDTVTFWCNGKLAWKGKGLKPARGYLGLQAEGAPMEFRNIRVKEIGYTLHHDLGKWTGKGTWEPADGGWAAAGKGSSLTSPKGDYKDAVIRLEYKVDKGSSGSLSLRGPAMVVDLGGEGAGGVGSAKPASKAENPPGQWNYLEVRLEGGKVTVWLNGSVVVKAAEVGKLLTEGPIVITGDKGFVVRNVRVKELPRS